MKTHLVLFLALGLASLVCQGGIVEIQSLKKDDDLKNRLRR